MAILATLFNSLLGLKTAIMYIPHFTIAARAEPGHDRHQFQTSKIA
jgi:hypothetical protein